MKNKILTMLLSLVISFGLWLYVVTVISPESESVYYSVPVELVGADYLDAHNLIIVSDTKNLRMDLTLQGTRSDLSKLNSSNITIIGDLSKITQAGEHRVPCSVSFQSGTAEVLAQNPEYISVVVAEQVSKTIPVKIIYTGSVPSGYEADKENVTLDHTTVTIRGPKETVEQVSYAGVTVDLTGKMTSFVDDYSLTLYGTNSQPVVSDQFVSANVTQIRTMVQVYKIKRVAVKFELKCEGSGLREDMVTVYSPLEEVILIGTDDTLSRVADQFVFTIDLSKYGENTTEIFTPELPEGVLCKEEIRADINIPTMGSIWLDVSRFTLVNVPEGLTAQINGSQEVEIWGPQNILDQLKAEDVVGLVDCTDITLSSGYAPVTYTVQGHEYLLVRVDWSNVFITVGHT